MSNNESKYQINTEKDAEKAAVCKDSTNTFSEELLDDLKVLITIILMLLLTMVVVLVKVCITDTISSYCIDYCYNPDLLLLPPSRSRQTIINFSSNPAT